VPAVGSPSSTQPSSGAEQGLSAEEQNYITQMGTSIQGCQDAVDMIAESKDNLAAAHAKVRQIKTNMVGAFAPPRFVEADSLLADGVSAVDEAFNQIELGVASDNNQMISDAQTSFGRADANFNRAREIAGNVAGNATAQAQAAHNAQHGH